MANTAYVNISPSESDWDVIPKDRPRHSSVDMAHRAQVAEGWPVMGMGIVVEVDADGQNLGVAH